MSQLEHHKLTHSDEKSSHALYLNAVSSLKPSLHYEDTRIRINLGKCVFTSRLSDNLDFGGGLQKNIKTLKMSVESIFDQF